MFTHDPFGDSNENCWGRQSQACSLWTPIWLNEKWALCLEHFLTKRETAHIACAGLITSWGNLLPYLRLSGCSFALLKHVCPWPSSAPQLSVFQTPQGCSWDHSSLLLMVVERRGVSKVNCPSQLLGEGGDLLAMKDLGTILKLTLLSLLYKQSIVTSRAWPRCCIFLGNSNIKIQWTGMFRVLS